MRDAFLRHRRGEWVMPAKVYLESPPHGDFRAMPALRRRAGDPEVDLVVSRATRARGCRRSSACCCVSDAETSEPLAMLDARAVTALRTGAVAAGGGAGARARGRGDASGSSAAACTAPGRRAAWRPPATARASASIPRAEAAAALADELGWSGGHARGGAGRRRRLLRHAGPRDRRRRRRPAARAAPQHARRRRPGQGGGDDRRGRRLRAVLRRVGAGLARRRADGRGRGGPRDPRARDRPRRGAGRRGAGPRRAPSAVTLFDSTGLAIQDLAIAAAALSRRCATGA